MRKKAIIAMLSVFIVGLAILAVEQVTLFAICWTLFSSPIALVVLFMFVKDELKRKD